MKYWSILVPVLFALCSPVATAMDPEEYAVDVRVEIQLSPPAIILAWPQLDNARQYVVRRKTVQQTDWSAPLATLPASATVFTDLNVSAGSAYEYEIRKELTEPVRRGFANAYTYVYAGMNVPVQDYKGKVIVIVDSSVAAGIQSELSTFLQDLTGAGWVPLRRDVGRTAAVTEVKEVIRSEYNADPGNVRSVILIGHVPVPYSGNIAPDLHETHRGAWPADLYYADMDGVWTDQTVNVISFDREENDNQPGDGKFDQSKIPSPVELEIGRIDFWNLPAFAPRSETDLLRNYLQKNHRFRHRQFTIDRRGLIRDNFGDIEGDAPAVDAWRHFGIFFGPDRIYETEANEFLPTLATDGFLWAYGCGGGDFTRADGVATTAEFASSDPKAVFLMLHGSYFGDWNIENNLLRAAIATPGYTLASVWTGLPHWFMHHMALGQTIGFSTRISQNNTVAYKSQLNYSAAEVHISLIGDPTLEMFPVIPPAALSGSAGTAVDLVWSPSSDTDLVGYHVYHSTTESGPFQRLTGSPQPVTTFSHAVGAGKHHYMVRAVKLEKTGSGTFFNVGQGIFTTVTKTSDGGAPLPTVTIATEDSDASESGPNPGSFRISRDPGGADSLRVEFLVGGIATMGLDYEAIPSEVIIPAGSASVLLTISPIPDDIEEEDESVTVLLTRSANYTIGSPPSAVLFIKNHSPGNALSRIENVGVDRGGAVLLQLRGEPLKGFRVETTSDIRSWSTVGEGVCDPSGWGEYRDETANGSRMRLYRVVWPE